MDLKWRFDFNSNKIMLKNGHLKLKITEEITLFPAFFIKLYIFVKMY